jgi:hypothetical protein
MTSFWNSLFCRCDDQPAVADHLRAALTALGYTLYNPFGALPGAAYPVAARLFVAPAAGWVRILGEPDEAVFAPLSRLGLCLFAALHDDGRANVRVYEDGAEADLTALAPLLPPGFTVDDLRRALAGGSAAAAPPAPAGDSLPLDALPDDIRRLAGGVNPNQAQNLFNRISGQLMRKVGGERREAAALVRGQPAPDWNSPGGQAVTTLAAGLALPENWRVPDFATLRDAYALHERRRRRPDAPLYPGDEAVMAQVPDALAYIPVYGGKTG